MKKFVIPKKLKSNAYYKKNLSTIVEGINLNNGSTGVLIEEIHMLGNWVKRQDWEALRKHLENLVAITTPVVDETIVK
jgi:hypothetical protein